MASVLEDTSDPWTAQAQAWTQMVGFSTLAGVSKSRVSTQVELWSTSRIQSMIKDHRSLVALSEPDRWFTIQPHVNDSSQSRILNRFRAADVGLGNRRPNVLGGAYKECPLCLMGGSVSRLDEIHVALVCPAVGFTRRAKGIEAYQTGPLVSQNPVELIMRGYLGGDGADPKTMMARANALQCMLEDWFRQVSLA